MQEIQEAAHTAAKSPASYGLLTYLWVFALALLGGVAGAIRRAKADGKISMAEIIGELAISAFAGIVTFYLCEWAGLSQLLSAAMVGISGHMGSRAIFTFEKVWSAKLGAPDGAEEKA